jgi:hypothetical protein
MSQLIEETTPHISSYQWHNRIPSRYEDLFDDIVEEKSKHSKPIDYPVLDSRKRLFANTTMSNEHCKF